MEYMSFGADAGHLMERLLAHAGAIEVNPGTVKLQPEADQAALDILREAAQGKWIVEFLDAGEEPDTEKGEQLHLTEVRVTAGSLLVELAGETVSYETGVRDGGWLRLPLRDIEKVHIF